LKRVNVPIPDDLYRELKITGDLYNSSITKLVASAIRFALMYKRTVWGFSKKDETPLLKEGNNETAKKKKP